MEKVKLALNIALMIEMIRAAGYSEDEMIAALKKGDHRRFEEIGEGIPDWETLIQYGKENWDKTEAAIRHGYEITFLTFGALRSLLRIKFNLLQEEDYQMADKHLENVKITAKDLESLKSVIAKNWTIVETGYDAEKELKIVRIELTHQPFNHPQQ